MDNDAVLIRQDLFDDEAGRNEGKETLGQDADVTLEVVTSCAHRPGFLRPLHQVCGRAQL